MSMKNRLMPNAVVSCAPSLNSKVVAGAGAQAHPAHKGVLMSNVERVQGFVRSTAVLVRRLQDIEVHLQADDLRRGFEKLNFSVPNPDSPRVAFETVGA